MERRVSGSCQCGAVRFAADTALDSLVACNCSRCRRMGWVLQPVAAEKFTLIAGSENLSIYRFNTETIAHGFCAICGIEAFASGTDASGQATYMINVHCLDGVQYDRANVIHFNGAAI